MFYQDNRIKKMMRQHFWHKRIRRFSGQQGFSLLELVIAMVIAGIVIAGIVAAHHVQQKNYRTQTMVINTQQNLRAAFHRLQNELLMAGYDRTNSERFGLININRLNDNSAITFSGDFGATGNGDNGTLDGGETISFFLASPVDAAAKGTLALYRRVDGGQPALLAEGIEAMRFAYAFDDNPRDGRIDFVNKGGVDDDFGFPIKDADEHYIWAVDSDQDGRLDTNLDTNQDGLVNEDDTPGGTALVADVDMERIRGIKIWLLARTRSEVLGRNQFQAFNLAGQPFTKNDSYKRRLLTATLIFRNMGI
jgi:type IV pilus assembly protein PilW